MDSRNRICIFLILLAHAFSYGQVKQYSYQRELKGVIEQWHSVPLPVDVLGKLSQQLFDIRIVGITAANDTIEAPYLIRIASDEVSNKEVAFKTFNASYNDKGYYFTFEIPTKETINQIELNFGQANFDWRVKLEGSHDQREWFTVIENYRILSIKNELTDFRFTKLTLPGSAYRYMRVHVDSKEKPELTTARITHYEVKNGTFNQYTTKKLAIKENKTTKQTEIDIETEMPVRVSRLKVNVNDSFDYYRPITIEYVTDSFKTEQGWQYNYSTLTSGTLNSIEETEFKFNSTLAQKLRIIILNYDNQPLTIDGIHLKGEAHELLVRFTEPATYTLVYGNANAAKPQYDLDHFADKVPAALTKLELGNEVVIKKEMISGSPLFKNKAWLWGIMVLIILVLGWFSVKMIRKN